MAINKNHLFQDLEGTPCAIVETKVSEERMNFLKSLLEYNGYKVIVVPIPPPAPKLAPAIDPEQPGADTSASSIDTTPPGLPPAYTLGVTDVAFNPTNAVFGRQLKTPNGHIVTLAYWNQQETVSHDEVPYYARKV